MKSPISGILFAPTLAFFLLLCLGSCSDENLEPVGGTPVDEVPMENSEEEPESTPGENSGIGDNPVLRLNCGGDEIGYGDTVFTEDNYFGGDTMDFENTMVTDVMETEMDGIYLQQRTTIDDLGSFAYTIPITNGTYILKLHFAELHYGAPSGGMGGTNARVFDIEVEGAVILEAFDMFMEAGALTAIVKEFEITIDDQELNIRASASTDRPALSAIEVLGDGQIINP